MGVLRSPSKKADFSWRDFLDLARSLADPRIADEARYRSAISRAYYAAHHAACRFLRREGVTLPKTAEAHEIAIRELERRNRNAGGHLSRLRQKRTWADYRIESKNARAESEFALAWAKMIVDALDPPPPEPPTTPSA